MIFHDLFLVQPKLVLGVFELMKILFSAGLVLLFLLSFLGFFGCFIIFFDFLWIVWSRLPTFETIFTQFSGGGRQPIVSKVVVAGEALLKKSEKTPQEKLSGILAVDIY